MSAHLWKPGGAFCIIKPNQDGGDETDVRCVKADSLQTGVAVAGLGAGCGGGQPVDGAGRVSVCDYVSINGDFQSYNVFRRILAGQTPYLDFVNYIGMAPVWINLPLVALNNTFAGSLFATNFTSNLLFSAAVLIWVYLVVRRLSAAMVVSAALTKFVSSGLLATVGGPAGAYPDPAVPGVVQPGQFDADRTPVSALFAGGSGFAVAGGARRSSGRSGAAKALADPKPCLLVGGLAGAGLLWSSDFGLATAFSVTVFFLLVQTAHWRGARAFAGAAGFVCGGVGRGLPSGRLPGYWFPPRGLAFQPGRYRRVAVFLF